MDTNRAIFLLVCEKARLPNRLWISEEPGAFIPALLCLFRS